MNRFAVAELKQLVARPDVVEMHDVTAQDPKLLVHLKATRNSVPVPRHWCFKRKYLQGKRGIEKPPFELPEFIKRTGIQEMREALQEKVWKEALLCSIEDVVECSPDSQEAGSTSQGKKDSWEEEYQANSSLEVLRVNL
ncbi:PREDICTED: splicing factor 3B subunit 2-like [Thamnophis sirtalis]|uniref:Splicing factor 3B subunit 2-like n=1 Tax=Thamnophis sirtalis TaxID=35019 RepID=A0A6I9YW33_9SAUR|nr:PREDICTED: splicing factor 3B subunit 2-like [Thamnophis sirtalis]